MALIDDMAEVLRDMPYGACTCDDCCGGVLDVLARYEQSKQSPDELTTLRAQVAALREVLTDIVSSFENYMNTDDIVFRGAPSFIERGRSALSSTESTT